MNLLIFCITKHKSLKYIFFEIWKSQKLWQAHMESDHLKKFIKATDGFLIDFNSKSNV